MQSIKHKNLSTMLTRTVIASSCSVLLLLGAASASAEHHEDSDTSGAMTEQTAPDANAAMPADAAAPATEQAKESVAEAQEDISEAREDVAEASENVADKKEELAQERQELGDAQDQKQQAMADEMPTVQRTANSIIGKKIQNGSGDEVGEISDIGVDWQGGKVPFVVVTSGGVMGVGGDQYKVPLDSLSAAPDDEYFTMETTEKDLQSEFSKFEPLDERDEQK